MKMLPMNYTEQSNMKIVDAIWFTEMSSIRPIGIVISVDEQTGNTKAYIGTAIGNDEGVDALHIVTTGATLHPRIVKNIFQRLTDYDV